MIKINNLKKDYNSEGVVTNALKNINLEIKKGEFVAIMGASGSGKSTLLHILGGMDKATSGEYFYGDTAVHSMSSHELNLFRREYVDFVFQNASLMQYYSVAENIEMPLLSMNIPKKERKAIVQEKMEAVGIEKLAKKLPTHLSGGEQTRVAIARALVGGKDLLLADEPTGSLDQKTGTEIMKLFEEVHKNGKTIVLITHDVNVAAYAERIIHISDGGIVNVK